MDSTSVRGLVRGIAGMTCLFAGSYVFAQERATPASSETTTVSVPFVGCKADGQAGPVDAPKGSPVSVQVSAKAAKELAYYSGIGLSVLGPRGWHCFGYYGSSGQTLIVSFEPIETAGFYPAGFTGPVIEVSHSDGGTGSGAFGIAEVIARVFPDFQGFAKNVSENFGAQFSFGPYPKDKLTYRSNKVVEYITPALTEGLGTHLWLQKSDSQIEGVAILVGQPVSHLLLLSMRLPPDSRELSSAIIRQTERDSPKVMH